MITELARGLRKPPPLYILLVFLTAALPLCTGELTYTVCCMCSFTLQSPLLPCSKGSVQATDYRDRERDRRRYCAHRRLLYYRQQLSDVPHSER